jgi:DNA replication protein DnaC
VTGCPDDRCDGSGFLFDEELRTASPCSCRPQRLARKRASAVAGRLPKLFRGVSFDREPVVGIERDHALIVRDVRSYVRNLSENLAKGRGMWFVGSPGTGKTTLAMLISKAAMEADHTVAIYSLPRLLSMLRETYDDRSEYSLSELLDRLSAVDLLHVDDVGAEQTSPWVLEQLYTIVNTRYEDGRALVLTTNLDGEELQRQIGERTVSRIYEMCGEPMPMFGDDHRKQFVERMPEPAGEPVRRPGRWRADAGADDAYWEHGETAPTAPAYGRQRPGNA